jgi:hypothetical protein
MASKIHWNDEYWLLLMQLYLKKPVGVKPLYSRPMVDLSLELHIPPKYVYRQMVRLRNLDTPRIERLWNTFSNNPRKLSRMAKLFRGMNGFNNAEVFYEGVEVKETFETLFKPIPQKENFIPIMLIIILDLYFILTPNTMVEDTPEIKSLAKMMGIRTSLIIEVMDIFQVLDPCLRRTDMPDSCLAVPCKQVWQRFGNDDPTRLAAYAAQLHEYFR